ncbi:MAG: hypothetical protein J5746_03695, partial [Victivallales bacterium]|nr:hypothetical protein [Victivallales bacterium]
LSYKNLDFLANFIECAKKCSNEYIFVFPLANPDFRGYVRSGRWVGEVSQTMYVRAWEMHNESIGYRLHVTPITKASLRLCVKIAASLRLCVKTSAPLR